MPDLNNAEYKSLIAAQQELFEALNLAPSYVEIGDEVSPSADIGNIMESLKLRRDATLIGIAERVAEDVENLDVPDQQKERARFLVKVAYAVQALRDLILEEESLEDDRSYTSLSYTKALQALTVLETHPYAGQPEIDKLCAYRGLYGEAARLRLVEDLFLQAKSEQNCILRFEILPIKSAFADSRARDILLKKINERLLDCGLPEINLSF